ncbi:LrgB family protein [Galbibacter sp.]|uniref:LrgB family protein n=1 Tax=Galbibacter sp. TaxID=2918471 RepID=UPI002BD78482|nr:LrgB family protein [Galbibacter sp.]HLV62477.1 LrgB family protein [Galbibacter sp.]
MKVFFEQPIFGVTLTLLAYYLSGLLKRRFNYILFNRILVSVVMIILVLLALEIDFKQYNIGGKYISFFLGPSVVSLGVFLFEKLQQIKQDIKPFMISVILGGLLGMLAVLGSLYLWNSPEILAKSLIAKSVTTPIAIEITKVTEGLPEITAGIVIITGILGNAIGAPFLRKLGITNPLAIGTALGTSAHGIGTARAFEISTSAGVYSGLAMCFNGLLTALLAPYILQWVLT